MLFDEAAAVLESYPDGVLSTVDADGYPLSVRCKPRADRIQQGFYLSLPDKLPIQAGAASMLFHYHDAALNHLRSVSLQGKLKQQDGHWLFQPERIIPGMGREGFLAGLKDNILVPRGNTKRYLQKYNLVRPRIPWEKLQKIIDEVVGRK